MELRIDRYEVKRLIGQGAMGKIYLARDPKLGRDVAIKMLSSQTADPLVRGRFRMEARAIAALKHPNIVELYDYSGEQAEDLFLVLEYVPGQSLSDHVVQHGPMPEVTALCVAHELVLALDHAHQHKVVHRDLKPENVLLYRGRVVLTDFGIVKQIAAEGILGEQERTKTQTLGTPGFMAPEQYTGDPVSTQTDIFALGAMLYNLTTGKLPFPGENVMEVAERVRKGVFEDPRRISPMLSDGFAELVGRCLRIKPKERYATAEEVRADVIDTLRAHGVTEVRKEIVDYEENPATHAIEQRERGIEVLLRDLKLAIKDRDEPRVQAIVKRMQTLAPLGRRIKGISGLQWQKGALPRLAREDAPRGRFLWLSLGTFLGAALGAGATMTALAMGLVPTHVMVIFERFADWLGYGY